MLYDDFANGYFLHILKNEFLNLSIILTELWDLYSRVIY